MKELNCLEKTVAILFDVLFDVVHYGTAIDECYAKERLKQARTYLLENAQPKNTKETAVQNTTAAKSSPDGTLLDSNVS